MFLPLSEVQKIRVGCGWDIGDEKLDLDVSSIILQVCIYDVCMHALENYFQYYQIGFFIYDYDYDYDDFISTNKLLSSPSPSLLQDVDKDGDLDPIEYIYYKNKKSKHGGIEAAEDNRTGSGDGDNEVIKINLANIPRDVDAIAITVSIYEGATNFNDVKNAYVRIFSPEGHEYLRFNLR